MKMVGIDQAGVIGITPGFGVKMDAEDQVRLDHLVYASCALVDLSYAVKETLGLPVNRVFP